MKTKTVGNVSDAKVSNDPEEVIVTYSLGSCIAVCVYDPAIRAGGMLHYQLPSSSMEPERARQKPFMFADTGMKLLIGRLAAMGANTKRMQVKIAGGAAMEAGPKGFDIGKRNHLAIRKVLWQHGMFIHAEDVGGSWPRHMYLDVETGTVTVKGNGQEKTL